MMRSDGKPGIGSDRFTAHPASPNAMIMTRLTDDERQFDESLATDQPLESPCRLDQDLRKDFQRHVRNLL
jgi:hypothetical protein